MKEIKGMREIEGMREKERERKCRSCFFLPFFFQENQFCFSTFQSSGRERDREKERERERERKRLKWTVLKAKVDNMA
jgi:hypothetical protein